MRVAARFLAAAFVTILRVTASAAAPPDVGTHRPALPDPISPPPLDIDVLAAPDVPRSLVDAAVDEAARIWAKAGVIFHWHLEPRWSSSSLRVTIGDETGRHHDDALALGWLGFRTGDIPDTNIHISRANARVLLQRYFAAHVTVEQVPMARVEQLLGRALGRALAHELGHYLMASPAHARSGLMRGNQQADDFFWPDSRAFDVGDEDLQLVASAWPRVALSTRPAVATAGG